MRTTKCIPSLTRDKNWLKCTKAELDFENQALVSVVICLKGIWGVVARAITLRVKIQIQDDHLSTPWWSTRYRNWQTGDCDTIQKGLKSNVLAEGGIRRLFVAHNGFKISLGKLDKGLIQVGAWNLQLAFRKKELLERSLNFWEGWWGVWVWSIHFSLLDAGVGGGWAPVTTYVRIIGPI